MSGLSVLVLGDAPGDEAAGLPLLLALGAALGPGDRLAWIADRPEAAFRLRLAAETEAWPEAVPRAIPDPPVATGLRGAGAAPPGWPRCEAIAAGLALLQALPGDGPLVTLPAALPPEAAGPRLAAIRAALASGADLLELRFGETQSLFRLESVVLPLPRASSPARATLPRPRAARHPARPRRRARARDPRRSMAPPRPSPRPGPPPRAALPRSPPWTRPPSADLPAFVATAPPGARAALAPILAAAGLALPPAPAPAVSRRAPLKVAVIGRHARRSPFSYPALADLWADWAEIAEDPAAADLVCLSHPLDLWDIEPVPAEWAGRTPLVLLSEEPFWDSLFSPDPLAPVIDLPAAHLGTVRLHQLNHHRAALFDWEHLPYLMFTDARTIPRYRARLARNAAVRPWGWRWRHLRAPIRATFMAERREEAFHDLAIPEGDIEGLCAWRTRVALAADHARVERLGASWQGGPTRFDLEDWHEDKLRQLDGRTRTLSALENTHQPTYLSEKFLDAFACGARALYRASPAHSVHRLGLPADAWLNVWEPRRRRRRPRRHGQAAESLLQSLCRGAGAARRALRRRGRHRGGAGAHGHRAPRRDHPPRRGRPGTLGAPRGPGTGASLLVGVAALAAAGGDAQHPDRALLAVAAADLADPPQLRQHHLGPVLELRQKLRHHVRQRLARRLGAAARPRGQPLHEVLALDHLARRLVLDVLAHRGSPDCLRSPQGPARHSASIRAGHQWKSAPGRPGRPDR